MSPKKQYYPSEKEVELRKNINSLLAIKKKLRRQMDDIDTEIIGYNEELRLIKEKAERKWR